MNPSTPLIKCQNVSKIFKVHRKDAGLKGSLRALVKREWLEKLAVDNVSFTVGPGEIVGLVGANGAGKTTLVKMLSGIIHPSAGELSILGHDPWQRSNDLRKQISLIMGQKASLWWDVSAADCFLLLKEIYQINDHDFKSRLKVLTEMLNVGGQLDVQIRKLSLGERMKMELMAALLHRPKVIFLDEPTIGLDLTTQKSIRQFLLTYAKEHQPAMILTSHYMQDIASLCQRIIIIKDGAFIYDGDIKNIMARFSEHKYLTIKIDHEKMNGDYHLNIPRDLGTILHAHPEELKMKIHRDQFRQTSGWLLQNLACLDMAIEETDLADVVEYVMTKGMI